VQRLLGIGRFHLGTIIEVILDAGREIEAERRIPEKLKLKSEE
jgi:hypothetical protein